MRWALPATPPTGWYSWTRAPSWRRARRPRSSRRRATSARAHSSARSSGTKARAVSNSANWERFLETFFNAKVMARYLPDIAYGMLVTVELAALVIVSGLALGLALALLRSLGFKPINLLIVFAVDLFRALPPLVIIVFIYFGLPAVGIAPTGFVSTWLSLALVLTAFSEEIFWAGITSIARGQWEAARSTGLSYGATLINVVLPQALRLTIPPLTNRTIAITTGTAVASVVAVSEILR